MSIINTLIIITIVIAGALIYRMTNPDFFNSLYKSIQPMVVSIYPIKDTEKSESTKEGFSDSILKVVGKEPLPPNTLYLNDYDMGNAKRYTSSLPTVINGGFSMPDSYYFHPVPDYLRGYELAVMDSPRSSEFNRGSHNDIVPLYYQTLYGKIECKN
jgi:hypothetical protein